ncbi:MAG: hypothetical protein R2828_04750 [Saprospiraceae bacterium]
MKTPLSKLSMHGCLLLLGSIMLWQCGSIGQKSPADLYNQYYEPFPAPTVVNGEDGEEDRETWNRAGKLYGEGDFVGAIEGFKQALGNPRPPDATVNFYLGVSHLALSPSQPKEAIPYFDAVLKEKKAKYFEEARWYRAIAYLNWGKISEAKIMLARLIQEGGFKQAEATKLYDQLPKE